MDHDKACRKFLRNIFQLSIKLAHALPRCHTYLFVAAHKIKDIPAGHLIKHAALLVFKQRLPLRPLFHAPLQHFSYLPFRYRLNQKIQRLQTEKLHGILLSGRDIDDMCHIIIPVPYKFPYIDATLFIQLDIQKQNIRTGHFFQILHDALAGVPHFRLYLLMQCSRRRTDHFLQFSTKYLIVVADTYIVHLCYPFPPCSFYQQTAVFI